MKFNTAYIFRRAHALAHRFQAEGINGTYRALFAAALHFVWQDVKENSIEWDQDVFDYFGIDSENYSRQDLERAFVRFFREQGSKLCGRKGFKLSELGYTDSWVNAWAADLVNDFDRGNTIEDLYDEVDEFIQGGIHNALEREFAA